ncbi:MAG: AI-2E family transporter [Chloroflexi bacterium]|nr:AI-2E family transporter [Chloroflexota bacterium]
MPKELTVRVSARTVGWTLLIFSGVWITILLNHVLVLFFVAVLLAVAISGVVQRFEQLRIARPVTILVIYTIIIAMFISLGFVLVPMVSQQVRLLAEQFPNLVRQPTQQASAWLAQQFPTLRETLPTGDLAGQAAHYAGTVVGGFSGAAFTFGRTLMGVIINFIVVLVLAFFLVSRANVASNFIKLMIPNRFQERLINVTNVIGRRLGRWVWAQLTVATFYAVCFGMGLWMLGVPYPVALGVIGGMLELIPYVGGFVATILTMLVAFTVQPMLAVWVLVLHLIVGNIEVHIIAPKVMGHAVETHPVITILALFSGIELLGIIGGVIAIPLAVVGQALVEEFWIKRIREAQPAVEPLATQSKAPVVRRTQLRRRPALRKRQGI